MRSIATAWFVVLVVAAPATARAQACPSTAWDALTLVDGSVPEGCPIDLIVPGDGTRQVSAGLGEQAPEPVAATIEEVGGGPVNRVVCDYQVCGPKTLPGGFFQMARIRIAAPPGAVAGTIVRVGGAGQPPFEIPISAASPCPTPISPPAGFSCVEPCMGCTRPDADDDEGCAVTGASRGGPPILPISAAALLLAWRGRGARRARRARDRV